MTIETKPGEVHSDIIFSTDHQPEILVLKDNGDILVKGKLVTNDLDVVHSLREFLKEVQNKRNRVCTNVLCKDKPGHLAHD